MAAGVIVQSTKVGHTKADGWHRLVTPAELAGEVVTGAGYLFGDDNVGFDGTLANPRGFIEANGGHVIATTTLTETRNARQIAILDATRILLFEKHGGDLDDFWRSQFGHGIDCLTDIEAGYLCRAESLATIQDRMAEAAERARGRGFSTLAPASQGRDHTP
jgi:hypothetical protein